MRLSEDARLIAQDGQPLIRTMRVSAALLRAEIARLGTAWTARRRRIQDAEQLATFNDRELWDLGLGRSDLPAITNGTYRRD